jgi:hypothetical protein
MSAGPAASGMVSDRARLVRTSFILPHYPRKVDDIMRDDCPTRRNIIDRQDRIFCRGGLGEGKGLTRQLAEAHGISWDTLKSYRVVPSRAESVMGLDMFVKLAKERLLPIELLNLLIEGSGYALHPVASREKDWLQLAEKAAALASKVCRYQATGPGIDHGEDADLTDDLRTFAADAEAMVRG